MTEMNEQTRNSAENAVISEELSVETVELHHMLQQFRRAGGAEQTSAAAPPKAKPVSRATTKTPKTKPQTISSGWGEIAGKGKINLDDDDFGRYC